MSSVMAISQSLFTKKIPLYHSTFTAPLMAKTLRLNSPNLISLSAHMKSYDYVSDLGPIEIPPEKPAEEPPISPPSPGPDFPLPPCHDPHGPDMPGPPPEIVRPGGPDVLPPTAPEIVPPGWPDVTPPEIVPPGGPDVVPPKRQEPKPWQVPQPDIPPSIIF